MLPLDLSLGVLISEKAVKLKYGIVAYTPRPDSDWIDVNTDPDLGMPHGSLMGRMGEDVFLMEATPEMMEDVVSKLGTSEV